MCISSRLLQMFLSHKLDHTELSNYSVLPLSQQSGIIEKVDGFVLSRLPGLTPNVDLTTYLTQRGDSALVNFYASAKLFLLLSYIFSIGDRHQGNIMISSGGAITHIDFGLIFS
uniref:Putative phosphatidylinositol 3-kinase VPS34 n=1 Tax=Lygus hesperus TaxID=30085 RepID=A0A0A9YGV6_LYGHE